MLNKQINILPTYTDLPRAIKSTYAIPRIYLYHLEVYLNEIKKHNKIIFSPKFPYTNKQEYILTYTNDKLIYLERDIERVNVFEIEFDQIMMIRLSEDLLDAKYIIYYMDDYILGTLEISFNKTAYQLYEDIFDIVLKADKIPRDNRSYELKQSHPILYNYAYKALKLGSIKRYDYYDVYYVNRDKRVVNTEILSLELNKGRALITKDLTRVDTWFILKDQVKLNISNNYGLRNLSIEILDQEVLNIKDIKN